MSNSKIRKSISNNKLLIFFILAALSLFVSTIALATIDRGACKKLIGLEEDKGDTTTIKQANNAVNKDKNYYRLSRTVEPKNYKLILQPNITSDTFNGSVTITLRVKQNIRTLRLHSYNLTIHGYVLRNKNNKTVPIKAVNEIRDERELLIIDLQYVIQEGFYNLSIIYSGSLANKIIGLYGSRLKNGGFKCKE